MLQNQKINGSHDHIPYPTTTLQNLDEYQNGKTTVYLNNSHNKILTKEQHFSNVHLGSTWGTLR